MIRNFRLNRTLIVLGVFATMVCLASSRADAQVKPFKVNGGGLAPDGLSLFGDASPHSAIGTATHLGKYSGNGSAKVLTVDLATLGGTFKGTFTFVAANGDKLACTYGDTDNGAEHVGEYQLFDVGGGEFVTVFIAEFNPIPAQSTGRFKNVIDGSFIMVAVTKPFFALDIDEDGYTPPFNYRWMGRGWLKY